MHVKQIFFASVVVFLIGGCGRGDVPIPTAGLQLWLKADAGVITSDSTVGRWADQSGNGNDAFQLELLRQPLLVKNGLNGKPVIRFDGFDDRLGLTGSKRMSQITVFIVLKTDSGSPRPSHTPLTLGGADGDGHVWGLVMNSNYTGFSPDTINIFTGSKSWVEASVSGCCAFGQWHTISVVTDRVTWSTTLRSNGLGAHISHHAVNVFVSVPIGTPSGTGFGSIGGSDAHGRGDEAARCEVAEVILYDTVIADSLRLSVERYLESKYQIPPNP